MFKGVEGRVEAAVHGAWIRVAELFLAEIPHAGQATIARLLPGDFFTVSFHSEHFFTREWLRMAPLQVTGQAVQSSQSHSYRAFKHFSNAFKLA